jgi:site-specific DNA recombinase
MADSPAIRRCAIYTRKSSEEGLEQDFNSLQAQREACEAFIASQRGEGWKLVPTAFDDGGISGGTMERPALQRLLSDIQGGMIDVIVVYKVDRLTRSLADFAKMVEVFDARGVSFVAVTQQFNTTTSMGRLTLNVLLSFAQFEREVTGERIRDKIAASKKKGIWMGGSLPLGYRVENRKLLVIPEEADRVQEIYRRYLKHSGVRELASQLKRDDIRPKERKAQPATHFGRGALYVLLSNPIYIGQIRHKDICHPGQHEGIVDPELWAKVQQKLKAKAVRDGAPNRKAESSPLMGKLVDEDGRLLTPSHAVKRGRRYRYYVSPSLNTDSKNVNGNWRLPAAEIEKRIEEIVREALEDRAAIVAAAQEANVDGASVRQLLASAASINSWAPAVEMVRLSRTEIRVMVVIPFSPIIRMERVVPIQMRRQGVESRLVIPGKKITAASPADLILTRALGLALRWWELLSTERAQSAAEIAVKEGLKERYVQRTITLAFLAPDIVEAITAGRHPAELNLEMLVTRTEIPSCWKAQRVMLGFG